MTDPTRPTAPSATVHLSTAAPPLVGDVDFRALFDQIADGVVVLDRDWCYRYVNRSGAALLGHSVDTLVGGRYHDLFPEAVGLPFHRVYERALERQEPAVVELYHAPWARWFENRVHPSPEGLVIVFTDVTERRLLEERYRQAQKMDAVGQLAGGIAHDFNNLLTAIGASADLSLEALRDAANTSPRSPQLDVVAADLVEIRRATNRAADLTRQLLAFSRRQMLDPQPVDLNDVVMQAMPLVRRLVSADIRIDTVLDDGLGTVTVDPRQIEQVLVNLVVNARDALRGRPKPRITVATLDVAVDAAETWGSIVGADRDPRQRLLPHGVAPTRPALPVGTYAVLVVHDSGGGMDADTQARAFEPFFTTKPVGQGTGLGLATVYGIVKQSGGHVYLDSAPGQGTMCSVYLRAVIRPRASRPLPTAAPGAAVLPVTAAPGDAVGTVLLVEDEHAVRAALRRLLERAGHRVLEARHGADALAIWQARAAEVDLVFTDVVMPELGGLALVERLRADRPGIPVVFMSGHSETTAPVHAPLGPGTEWLTKPFDSAAMLRTLSDLLRGAAPNGERARG